MLRTRSSILLNIYNLPVTYCLLTWMSTVCTKDQYKNKYISLQLFVCVICHYNQ